ncbi:hypothetical protein [Falsiroseomonas sp.]|uniref:hypothetical protein n=1 Tax=Falsiroseomonas sp. TaxID=2870721 RepID=UPI00272923E6|nr:hypothetical protein [Falsiroseomonas sp.]MDO9499010.1 hypothetical protein [Falsiroseomonas sp.]
MSWTPLAPFKAPALARHPYACTASTSAGTGRLKPKLSLVLRPGLCPGLLGEADLDWLAVDRLVDVMVGYAEHAGQLRIEPGSAFRLCRLARGRPNGDPVVLRLPMPTGIIAAERGATECGVFLQAGRLEVTLPAWGQPQVVPRGTQLAAQAAAEARRRAGL